jgi:hypothetical protein
MDGVVRLSKMAKLAGGAPVVKQEANRFNAAAPP